MFRQDYALLLARLCGVGRVMCLAGFVLILQECMSLAVVCFTFGRNVHFQLECLLLAVTRYIISWCICFRLDVCCSI